MALEDELLARMQADLAALIGRARDLISKRQFATASRLLGDGYRRLFGLDRRFLQMMQPQQVSGILGRSEKVTAFAKLMAEEADLLRVQGDVQSASATAKWTVRILESAKQTGDATLLARLRVMADLIS